MKVLFAASECTPYAKVGGLGDVIGALPQELVRQGVSVDIVLPLYEHLLQEKLVQSMVSDANGNSFSVQFLNSSFDCKLFYIQIPHSSIRLFLIQNDQFLTNGGVYLSPGGFAKSDDELARFMFFSKAVYTLIDQKIFQYDVVHAHDYHTSFLLYLLKNGRLSVKTPRLVLSIHSTGNQGVITGDSLAQELNGAGTQRNLLGVGIASADKVAPVSPTFTRELLSGVNCFGLEQIVSAFSEKFTGIANGLDMEFYNPYTDSFISHTYDEHSYMTEKLHNKETLFTVLNYIPEVTLEDVFVIGFVGRVVEQKNVSAMCSALDVVLHNEKNRKNFVVVFLGVGDKPFEDMLNGLSTRYPSNVFFVNRFDEPFAHKLFAAGDLFLIPSVYEPCGLTQLIAMRYGTLPLATAVGGLVDTIRDKPPKQTGFFVRDTASEFFSVQILDLYTFWKNGRDMWNEFVENAMLSDFSWTDSARKYISLYS